MPFPKIDTDPDGTLQDAIDRISYLEEQVSDLEDLVEKQVQRLTDVIDAFSYLARDLPA